MESHVLETHSKRSWNASGRVQVGLRQFLVAFNLFNLIFSTTNFQLLAVKNIYSMLLCFCQVIYHGRRQNMPGTKTGTHAAGRNVLI